MTKTKKMTNVETAMEIENTREKVTSNCVRKETQKNIKPLKTGTWNVRSLARKEEELTEELIKLKMDYIGIISET